MNRAVLQSEIFKQGRNGQSLCGCDQNNLDSTGYGFKRDDDLGDDNALSPSAAFLIDIQPDTRVRSKDFNLANAGHVGVRNNPAFNERIIFAFHDAAPCRGECQHHDITTVQVHLIPFCAAPTRSSSIQIRQRSLPAGVTRDGVTAGAFFIRQRLN